MCHLQYNVWKQYVKCDIGLHIDCFMMWYLPILKKITAATAAAVTENGPPISEKTNNFRNTKFGTQIAFR